MSQHDTPQPDRLASQWMAYGTDRKGLLQLAKCTPFECDNYVHTNWEDLPESVRLCLEELFD